MIIGEIGNIDGTFTFPQHKNPSKGKDAVDNLDKFARERAVIQVSVDKREAAQVEAIASASASAVLEGTGSGSVVVEAPGSVALEAGGKISTHEHTESTHEHTEVTREQHTEVAVKQEVVKQENSQGGGKESTQEKVCPFGVLQGNKCVADVFVYYTPTKGP